jgi:hypothetical protein
MNAPVTLVEAQTDALLRRLAREQESASRRVLDAAAAQARTLIERTRVEARARMRLALDEARQLVERGVAERNAALATAARQREQAALREWLDQAWQVLPSALVAAWDDPARRRAWCEAACAVARRTLLEDGAYVVEAEPAGLEVALDVARERLAASELASTAMAGLGPGLRLRRGLATVDATLAGLLASRERIEAEMLAELDALLAAPKEPGP